MFPQSLPGRIIGSVCAIVGTIVIALPVPIISENFKIFYKEERHRKLMRERKKARELAQGSGALPSFNEREKAATIIQKK